jgi:hypothetical protein
MVIHGIEEAAAAKTLLATRINQRRSPINATDETSPRKRRRNICSGRRNHQCRKLMILRTLKLK